MATDKKNLDFQNMSETLFHWANHWINHAAELDGKTK